MRKIQLGILYALARLASPSFRVKMWDFFTRDIRNGKELSEYVVPVFQKGGMILPALLRASIFSTLSILKNGRSRVAVPARISIGESLIYFHYTFLRRSQSGADLQIPDLGIAPNSEVIRYLFSEDERVGIDDPIHRRLKEQIKALGTERDQVAVDLYVNGLMRKFFQGRCWSDFGKSYDPSKDEALLLLRKERPVLEKSYLDFLQGENFYQEIDRYCKMMDLEGEPASYPGQSKDELEKLKKSIGLEKRYLTLFLRPLSGDLTSPRSIHHPEAYVSAIQHLKERGYQVVLMGSAGGERFPEVTSLEGVIDYPRSGFQSLANDLHLVGGGCEFMITCSSGPSSMPLLGKPTLWLNTVNPAQAIVVKNHRYYPKNVFKNGKRLLWSEWLESPSLYAQHERHYREAGLEWKDLDSDQILQAVKEFADLVEKSGVDWRLRTRRQEYFASQTRAYHLNMHLMSASPCEAFLVDVNCPEPDYE